MSEVDSSVAGRPYKRETKGRKEGAGAAAVIKLETLSIRAPDLMNLRIAMTQATKKYQDAITAVAEVCGLNATTVARYIRARCGTKFTEDRDRASQMAFVFEQLGELGEYSAPKEGDLFAARTGSNGASPPVIDGTHRKGGEPDEWPADLRVREMP